MISDDEAAYKGHISRLPEGAGYTLKVRLKKQEQKPDDEGTGLAEVPKQVDLEQQLPKEVP